MSLMWLHVFGCFAVVLVISTVTIACHVPDHVRERRQTNAEVRITEEVRKYFARCLRDKVGDIWMWESVVDYSVLDTHWYDNSDSFNCSRSLDLDTPECWKERVRIYLRNSSFLIPPCHDCIDQFGNDTSQGIRTYTVTGAISLATANRYELCVPPDSDIRFRPNSPLIRDYSSCNSESVRFPSSRTALDFPSVFQFVEAHTICGSEFTECDSNNRAIISQSNPDITRWPYRYEALTLDDSPLQVGIGLCNQRFFPPDVADWSKWSSCSASCGGGQRRRGLNCDGAVCSSTEVQDCNTQLCPMCDVSRFTRKRCIGPATTKQQCLDSGCCYDAGFCYRKGKPPSFTKFTPSVQPDTPFGGEPGFPGTSIFRCDRLLRGPRCPVVGPVDNIKCSRVGCCWDSATRTCYRGSFRVTKVRDTCPPGFTNPPRCDDINECSASPCMNGGTCRNMINGFLCDCPIATSGPTCSSLCTSPPSPTNGVVIPAKLSYNVAEIVSYQCNLPYILDGDLTNMCLATGTWSNPAPSCKLVCGTPPLNPNLIYTPAQSSYDVGYTVTYSCPVEFDLVGISTINLCTPTGWVNTSPPACNFVATATCGSPPLASQVSHTIVKSFYLSGESVTYSCPVGYNLMGSTSNQCVASSWIFPSPTCLPVCINPPTPMNGGFTTSTVPAPSEFGVGESITYTCPSPYILTGEPVTNTCIGPGTWAFSIIPPCSYSCAAPPAGALVTVTDLKSSYLEGETVTYSCPTGYSLVGASSNQCLITGWMVATSPTCTPVCTNPPTPTNGGFTASTVPAPSEFAVGDSITYTCPLPYVLVGEPITNMCIGPGMWAYNTPPPCIFTCGSPPAASLVTVTVLKPIYLEGESVTYSCPMDYSLTGTTTNECTATDWMFSTSPTCIPVCINPPTPVNGFFTIEPRPTEFGVGATITYGCNAPYMLDGEPTTNMCVAAGTWQYSVPPPCFILCGVPPPAIDGSYQPVQSTYRENEEVTYFCGVDVPMSGPNTNRCTASGWSNAAPICG